EAHRGAVPLTVHERRPALAEAHGVLGADEERSRIAPHRMAGGVDVLPPQSLRRGQIQVVAIAGAPARLGQWIGVTGGRVDVAHLLIVSGSRAAGARNG